MSAFIDRWIARRAFNALRFWMDRGGMSMSDHNQAIATLDILRKHIYKDWD
jgi:hypothetical protein